MQHLLRHLYGIAVSLLYIGIRYWLHHRRLTELKLKEPDTISDSKLRVKVCGVNISWVAWASTVQCSVFKACLPVCSLTEFSGSLSPATGLMMRSQTPQYCFQRGRLRASTSTGVVLSRTHMGPSQTGQGCFFRHCSYRFNRRHFIPGQPCHVTGNSSFLRLNFCSLDNGFH